MISIEHSGGICPVCFDRLTTVSEEQDVRIGRRSVRVLDQFSRCTGCDEAFYAPRQMDATLRRASEAIRQEEGLLSPGEIRAIRERLRLTQRAFEKLLGVGPKTVVRWEKGTVFQNRATDSLLRLVDAQTESARFLARLHGVTLSETPSLSTQ